MTLFPRIGSSGQPGAGFMAHKRLTSMAVLAVALVSVTLAGAARAGEGGGLGGIGHSDGMSNALEKAVEGDRLPRSAGSANAVSRDRRVLAIGSPSGSGRNPQRGAPRMLADVSEFAPSSEFDPTGLLGTLAIFVSLIAIFGAVLGIVELMRGTAD